MNHKAVDEIIAHYRAAHTALHTLWTAAVGTPGYDKATWKALSSGLDQVARDALSGVGFPRDQAFWPWPQEGGYHRDPEHYIVFEFMNGRAIRCRCFCGYRATGIDDSDTAVAIHIATMVPR